MTPELLEAATTVGYLGKMPRKKSVKRAAQDFVSAGTSTARFLSTVCKGQSDEHQSELHDHAVIVLYRAFESLMLQALIGAINNDTTTISSTTGVAFPTHLTDEVCGYLITHGGYFDFKGRDGLIKVLKQFVPEKHYLVEAVKKAKYKEAIEQLCALRNFAAHLSPQSKRAALKAIGLERISSAGAWVKRGNRFADISDSLTELAREIEAAAPY